MPGRSISLRAQLLIAFVVVIVGTTAGLTFDAYRRSRASLEEVARRGAASAAHARAQALTRMLQNRQQRAEGFLEGAHNLCAESSGPGRYAWALDCLLPMLDAFRAAEGAASASIRSGDRVIATSGTPVPADIPAHDALARVTWHKGRPAYVMRANRDGVATMIVQYGNSEVASIFRDASHLGDRGEAFLMAPDGGFLTRARYAPAATRIVTPPGAAAFEPIEACRAGSGETLELDYRGVMTLHAYEPVTALEGGCVHAHMNYDEVLGPAERLREGLLWRGLLCIFAGALFSLVASHRIAAPVRRLSRAARNLRSRLDEPIPEGGPSEVRALARAIRETSVDIGGLIAREQAARREAQAANQAKDQFLAAVSHELRTPLTAILGWTRIVRGQQPLAPRLERALEAIERNATTQRHLIEDLLDVSRIVTGRLRLDRQLVHVPTVVERALDTIRPQAAEKDVAVQTLIEHDGLTVEGDELRLQQIVTNLAANAVKFSAPGGRVLVSVSLVGDTVQLSVHDQGQGIDEAALPHVFEWFWQGEATEGPLPSGLGLGLGIVRQLVEVHGGAVRAESDGLGLGSRFVVTLPLVPAPTGPEPAPLPHAAPAPSSFDVH
jgi:signal transduction histidine kinase